MTTATQAEHEAATNEGASAPPDIQAVRASVEEHSPALSGPPWISASLRRRAPAREGAWRFSRGPLAGSVHGRSCGRPRRPRISPEGKVAVCTLAYAAPLCIASIISARPAAPASMP